MSYHDPKDGRAEIVLVFLIFLLALVFGRPAHADLITELGAGWKLPRSTSTLLLPECHLAVVIETRPQTDSIWYRKASCGGDNPAFIGWPIAWEREFRGPWRMRCGWFHYSNWFDGGHDRETHMDVAACAATFNWSRRK